jgi:hypothetical protein
MKTTNFKNSTLVFKYLNETFNKFHNLKFPINVRENMKKF